MTAITRTLRLRQALAESQATFAKRLRASQAAVSRLEAGQPESGPQSLVLDQIEAALAAAGASHPPVPPGQSPGPTAALPDPAEGPGDAAFSSEPEEVSA